MENNIIKKPIQINSGTIVQLHVFREEDMIDTCWELDIDRFLDEKDIIEEEAVKELLDQFGDWYNTRFLKFLAIESINRIDKEFHLKALEQIKELLNKKIIGEI